MRTRLAKPPGTCEVIEGQFAWFSQTCGQAASRETQYDGEWFYICDEHIAAARVAERAS